MKALKVIVFLAAAILILWGMVLIIASASPKAQTSWLSSGLICLAIGIALIWRAGRFKPAPPKSAEVAQRPDLISLPPTKTIQNKRAIWVGGASAAFLLACCGLIAVFGYRFYENRFGEKILFKEGGLALKYPPDWTPVDLYQKPNPVVKSILGLRSPDGKGHFIVQIWKLSENTSLADFAEYMKTSSGKDSKEEISEWEESSISGLKAYIWVGTHPDEEHPGQTINSHNAVVVVQDQVFFLFTYSNEPVAFRRYHPQVDQILASVQLTKAINGDSKGVPILCPTKNDDAEGAYVQAKTFQEKGQLEEAEKAYLKAIELDDHFCDAMDDLGLMLRKQGKLGEAIRWYQKSLEILQTNRLALRNMAVAYEIQGNTQEAIATFTKLVEIAPTDPEGYYGLGRIYYDTEKYKQALENLDTAETLYIQSGSPFVADAQYQLGKTYFVLKDCTRAAGYLEMVYDQHEEDSYVNYVLGVCRLVSEPQDLNLVKKYLLKAEELGMTLPEDVIRLLVEAFGEWPPK
jgi:tetratricopeptide (TPR) repeat protein